MDVTMERVVALPTYGVICLITVGQLASITTHHDTVLEGHGTAARDAEKVAAATSTDSSSLRCVCAAMLVRGACECTLGQRHTTELKLMNESVRHKFTQKVSKFNFKSDFFRKTSHWKKKTVF